MHGLQVICNEFLNYDSLQLYYLFLNINVKCLMPILLGIVILSEY